MGRSRRQRQRLARRSPTGRGRRRLDDAPLQVVQLRYTWSYVYSREFVPVRSYDELVAGEAAGIFEASSRYGESVRDLDDHRSDPADRAVT
jgi:hypothetical protein